jgi:hypothetical protein
MEVKTASGVSIKIVDEGSSKILIFSTSVRAIGLNKEETSAISALLLAISRVENPVDKPEFSESQDSESTSSEDL